MPDVVRETLEEEVGSLIWGVGWRYCKLSIDVLVL